MTESIGPMGSKNQTLGAGTASRRSAPRPGRGTYREDHALLIVPMSSGRLFLDRVGRHESPSPLHRQGQHNLFCRSEETNYHQMVSGVL
jgi:hypothetical protein